MCLFGSIYVLDLCTALRTFIDMALYKINIIIIITLMYEAASRSHMSQPMIPVGRTSMIRLWDFSVVQRLISKI